MFLRPYRPADKRPLQQLFYDTVRSVNARDYSAEQIERWAPEEPNREAWARLDLQHCFVVEYQKQLVGFASLSDEGLVDYLYVHKDFQNRSIASTLLKQLERFARKKGFEKLSTEASITALGFFEKMGFRVLSLQNKVYSGLEFPQFLMEKNLPQPTRNNT